MKRSSGVSPDGVQVLSRSQGACREFYITACVPQDSSPAALFRNVAEAIHELCAQVVSIEVFGIHGREFAELEGAFGGTVFPVTWIEEGCDRLHPLRGLQAWAVTGANIKSLHVRNRVVGASFEAHGIRFLRLGGLIPPEVTAPRREQARAVFKLMQNMLNQAGMSFRNVVRTWFYNHRMLEWYDDFNEVRTSFFNEHGVFEGPIPASTGIGGRNTAGAALIGGLLAIQGESAAVQEIVSPRQCSALDYGSSFSRAVEIKTPGLCRLLISGTASIAPDGHSVHLGDVDAQIKLTMEVVYAILESRGMSWRDVTRALAYFKDGRDAPAYERWRVAHRAPVMPVQMTNNEICREDLLFEVELDAMLETAS